MQDPSDNLQDLCAAKVAAQIVEQVRAALRDRPSTPNDTARLALALGLLQDLKAQTLAHTGPHALPQRAQQAAGWVVVLDLLIGRLGRDMGLLKAGAVGFEVRGLAFDLVPSPRAVWRLLQSKEAA